MSTSDHDKEPLNHASDFEVARSLKQTLERIYGAIIYAEHQFWFYKAPMWRPLAAKQIREHIYRFDGERPAVGGLSRQIRISSRKVTAITQMLADISDQADYFDLPSIGINSENGFVTFDEEGKPELKSHTPEHRQRHVVPAAWNGCSHADIPPESLLHQLLYGAFDGDDDFVDKFKLIAEVLGAVVLGCATRLKEPKAVVFFGERAANGKSAVLDLIRGIVPANMVSNLTLEMLCVRELVVKLRGKRLNASDELSARAITSDDFKLAVTGEPINGRLLYKNAEEFRAIAQHVYATNEPPTFRTGMDRGVRRRLLVLPFNHVIPPDQRIERLGQLVHEREAHLVLALAVEGASRLVRYGRFTEPESSVAALKDWVFGGDPVLGWVEACCAYGDDLEPVRTRDAYSHFQKWAIRERFDRRRLPTINNFVSRVKAVLPDCDPRGRAGAHYHRDKHGGQFRGLSLLG